MEQFLNPLPVTRPFISLPKSAGVVFAATDSVEKEIHGLLGWLHEHSHRLKEGHELKGVGQPPFHLESFARGKSSILYTFSGHQKWYVKFFLHQAQQKLRAEAYGLATMFQLFQLDPYVSLPDGLCVDLKHQFLLLTELKGIRLSKLFYLYSWGGISQRIRARLAHVFYQLGRMLSRIHREGEHQLPGAPFIRAYLYQRFKNALQRLDERQKECIWLKRWFEQQGFQQHSTGYVHRNLNLNNILVNGDRLVLLDFETFGRGDACEDLGQLLGNFLVLKAVMGFPKRCLPHALQAFWEGYGTSRPEEQNRLEAAVQLHLANYYLRVFLTGTWPRTIAGLPISRRRLRRLIEAPLPLY